MSEKRFTDIWCSETGHIGVTDYGIDKEFTSSEFEDFLNELSTSCRQLEREVKSLNAFLVHKGFAEEYTRWKGDV